MRSYQRWFSPSLQRTMEMLVFGHGGARVIIFPTSRGRFFEWEDRGMIAALSQHLREGWVQLFCVDSVDEESWYCDWAHPSGRAARHAAYDAYLRDEVLPFSTSINDTPFAITAGASFGGYHAATFGLRHPQLVQRIVALSGLYDIRRFVGGYYDETVYRFNPVDFIPNEHDAERMTALQRQDIILATGRDDPLMESARRLSAALWHKGIGNALREWDGWAHDWPCWQHMITHYIGGHD